MLAVILIYLKGISGSTLDKGLLPEDLSVEGDRSGRKNGLALSYHIPSIHHWVSGNPLNANIFIYLFLKVLTIRT